MIVAFLLWMACSESIEPELGVDAIIDPDTVVQSESVEGPVSVSMEVWPRESKLGDVITLNLKVTAEAEVELLMPAFGEALGQFQVAAFTPRETTDESGRTIASQRYDLQATSSGEKLFPSLRIAFIDRRGSDSDEEREVLTDEIPIEVIGLLDSDSPLVFEALKPKLEKQRDPSELLPLYLLAVLGFLISAYMLWGKSRQRARLKARRNAFDIAFSDLAKLEHEWAENCDDRFYAALSMIVRRYIESRYGLSAPEQTTEEFLSKSIRNDHFTLEQRGFLEQLMRRCDEVKFAGAEPNSAEASQLLQKTRHFLTDTRLQTGEAA